MTDNSGTDNPRDDRAGAASNPPADAGAAPSVGGGNDFTRPTGTAAPGQHSAGGYQAGPAATGQSGTGGFPAQAASQGGYQPSAQPASGYPASAPQPPTGYPSQPHTGGFPAQPAGSAPGTSGFPPIGSGQPTSAMPAGFPTAQTPPPGSVPPGHLPPGTGEPGEPPSGGGKKTGRGKAGLAAGAVALVLLGGGVGGAVGAKVADDNNSNTTSTTQTLSSGPRDNSQPTAAAPGSVPAVAQKVLPSVASIFVKTSRAEGSGSGIILSSDGYILTNNHVITAEGTTPASDLTVVFNDNSTAKARVIGTDPISDIAVVKVDRTDLQAITMGTSSNLSVGQEVIAVGSPLGLSGTVTSGIISALNRPVSTTQQGDKQASVMDAIQTDAAINPGNSGGALVNANGALIGVNSAIASLSSGDSQSGSIGLGFAIPIDQAMRIANELKATGKATQPSLGVQVTDPQSDTDLGAMVAEVVAGGPAEKGGIPKGALITKFDNRDITSADGLVAAVRSHAPGDNVSVTYSVGGQTKTTQVTLATLDTGGR
ncbi:S1C family serine protease [Jongsikchunia kroppenstedtii]|uniref:S1C family serine protease n=1 Tax=Jongsikchunia kroppenstedtii TaxID=1121721 RepID=UPI00036F5304|nr:trypsin-like peptidase domain-containing protein [Jongsikchunia kroppenstedtii]